MLNPQLAKSVLHSKAVTFFAFLFAFVHQSAFSADTLSNRAQVSLITISPGEDLYSAFGHSTIWILDTEKNIDRVYNYGTFDFEQPNFYMNFVKGHLDYTLTAYTFEEQYLMTQYEGRGLSQQVLDLDSIQKQRLYDFLEWNALPQNMHYLYDFYLDNCSSRLRDVLQKNVGPQLVFDKTIATPYSFRDWMNICLVPHPWSALFMNIGLGAPADKQTDYLTQMYLPINLKLGLSTAKNGDKPLVKVEQELLNPTEKEHASSGSGTWIASMLVLVLSILVTFPLKHFTWLWKTHDILLFAFVTILGSILAMLWAFTDHWVCAMNTDLLWANPICAVYFLLLTRLRLNKTVYKLSLLTLIISFCYFTVAFFLPEKPILVLFPLILGLQIRIVYHLLSLRNI